MVSLTKEQQASKDETAAMQAVHQKWADSMFKAAAEMDRRRRIARVFLEIQRWTMIVAYVAAIAWIVRHR